MKHKIEKILQNPNNYWVCNGCHNLNWYENDECHFCETKNHIIEPQFSDFDTSGAFEEAFGEYEGLCEENELNVLLWIDEEVKFFQTEYDFNDEDCNQIHIKI